MASIWKNCPRFNHRWADKVEAWNICSFYQDDQLPLLCDSLGILVVPLNSFGNNVKPFSLAVSWTKTQNTGFREPGRRTCPVSILVAKIANSYRALYTLAMSDLEVNRHIVLSAGAVNSLSKRNFRCQYGRVSHP